jgi:hypothetical protein
LNWFQLHFSEFQKRKIKKKFTTPQKIS